MRARSDGIRKSARGLGPALLLLTLSCVSADHATWWLGDVATEGQRCDAVAGDRVVLDRQEFGSPIFVPFAWSGYRLFIVADPAALEPGEKLTVPSDRARAVLCTLSHGADRSAIEDLVGTVEVSKRRGQDLRLRLELRYEARNWSFEEERWFEHQEHPTE